MLITVVSNVKDCRYGILPLPRCQLYVLHSFTALDRSFPIDDLEMARSPYLSILLEVNPHQSSLPVPAVIWQVVLII